MKRADVKKILGEDASDEVVDQIMEAHGRDLNKIKSDAESNTAELETLKSQLAEANTQIETFKAMKPDEIQKAADDWKTKYENLQQESAAQLQKVKFNHALERELKETYAVKDPRDVIPNLQLDTIKYSDAGFEGLKDQIEPLKEAKAYLFSDTTEPPRLVDGGNQQNVVKDSFLEAAFKGAGLKLDGNK